MTDRKPIVVVGSINMDLVVNAQRLPEAGETLPGSSFRTVPGGKGANQAVAIARLGYPVHLIGMVGDDDFGPQLRHALGIAGVGVLAVRSIAGSPGVAVIAVAAGGRNSILVVPGANNYLSPAVLDQHFELIRNAGLLLTQLEIPTETVLHLAKLCSEADVPLILNPAPARALPKELFEQTAWFTPNETEAAFFSSRPSEGLPLQEIARGFLDRGVKGVVLTLGDAGSYLAENNGAERPVSPFPVEAVDTTGAGDAFNGAFAVGLMMGKSPMESARFASAASALSVTRAGAQASMATLEEVEALLGTRSRAVAKT